MAIADHSAPFVRSLLYALAAPLVFVACTFPRVIPDDAGETPEGSIEPAADAKVGASEASGATDSTIEANEASAEAKVDTSTTGTAPPRESGGDAPTLDDSATTDAGATDAGTIDDGSLDALGPNCDCGPGQSLYPTGVQCGLLGLGVVCTQSAGFVNALQPCGTVGEYVTCVGQGLGCATASDQMLLQQCH